MKKQEFELVLYFKIQDIADKIMQLKKISLPQALKYIYGSKLYQQFLADEETKTWHIGTEKLLIYLENEKAGKSLLPIVEEL